MPYPAGFDYLDPEHVRVQVTLADESVIDLGSSAYSVAVDGIRTAVAYGPEVTVKIYRLVPLTMPLSLPLAGALSPAAIERALVMVVQQIQQIARAVDGSGVGLPIGSGNALEDTAVWSDSVARLSVRPKRTGQMGVEFATQTIWIAQSTVPGDWEEFSPQQDIAQSLVLLATADAGIPGTLQSQIVSLAQSWNVDGVLTVGDNRYDPHSFAAAWAAFAPLINDDLVFPALGNHDYLDWAAHEALFSYLPPNSSGHRRYYSKILGNGLLGLITIHSGYGHAGTVIEPDGVGVGSIQHAWFVATLAAMEKAGVRWIVVQMHHPTSTVSDEATRAFPDLFYPEFSRVHGVFCGHVHLNEWLSVRGVPMINVSGCIQEDGHVSYGVGIAGIHEQTELLWVDDRTPMVARLQISPSRFLVQFCDPSTGRVRYQRSLQDATSERACWDREIIAPTEAVPVGEIYMGLSPSVIRRPEFFIAVRATAGSPLQGTVKVDGVTAASWTIPAGNYFAEVTSTKHIRRGAEVVCIVDNNAAYPAWEGLQMAVRGLLCS